MGDAADRDAEARRRARASCEVRRFGPGEAEQEADADALYWDRIPLDERAEFVWQLSVELYGLASDQPGLSRFAPRDPRG